MALILPNRRGFLGGLAAGLFCAPAIVRATSLMPVKVMDLIPEDSGWATYIIEGQDHNGKFIKEIIKYRTMSDWAARADMVKPYFRKIESIVYSEPLPWIR